MQYKIRASIAAIRQTDVLAEKYKSSSICFIMNYMEVEKC